MSRPGVLFWIVLLGVIAVTAGLDCTGQDDGIYEYSCFQYVICSSGVAVEIRCNASDVFDPDEGRCITPVTGDWPCTEVEDCSTKADGRYPVVASGCRNYYTCFNNLFYGHNYCPQDLVYDSVGEICNWPYNVAPPCGTCTTCGGI